MRPASNRERPASNERALSKQSLCLAQVKALFQKLEVDAKIIELDEVVEGDDVQVLRSVCKLFARCAVHILMWVIRRCTVVHTSRPIAKDLLPGRPAPILQW